MRKNKSQFPSLEGMVFSPIAPHRLPFEEGLARAEKDDRIIKEIGPGLFLDRDISPLATGTIAAHTKPGEKLGKTIEKVHSKTGQRWVFYVPEEYQKEKNALLFVNHPFWVLETDGNNFVIHSEPTKVEYKETFPRENGAYRADRIEFPYVEKKMTQVDGKWVSISSSAAELAIEDSRVGPLLLGGRDYRFCKIRLDWRPNMPCLVPVYTKFSLQNVLIMQNISADSPLRRLRNLPEVKVARVILLNSGKVLELPEGSPTSYLSELPGSARFSCMSGSCCRCSVRVVSGMENLEPPGEEEQSFTENHPGYRLACLTKIKKGEVKIS